MITARTVLALGLLLAASLPIHAKERQPSPGPAAYFYAKDPTAPVVTRLPARWTSTTVMWRAGGGCCGNATGGDRPTRAVDPPVIAVSCPWHVR